MFEKTRCLHCGTLFPQYWPMADSHCKDCLALKKCNGGYYRSIFQAHLDSIDLETVKLKKD